MAAQNFLIMNLLRLITPEEIGDIATKHNGGKFLSLTDLVTERVEQKIYRDFTSPEAIDEIHQAHNEDQAKILPFKKEMKERNEANEEHGEEQVSSLTDMAQDALGVAAEHDEVKEVKVEHNEDENMSSFILIEKARLKKSQKTLKQKEIIDLYQKNSNVDVEQIRGSNSNLSQSRESGVLVNKKQY